MNTFIGSIKKIHGYQGAIIISIEKPVDIELIENCINKKELVFINIDEIQVPFFISQEIKILSNKSILVFLDDIVNDYQAKKYINHKIFVENTCFDKSVEANIYIDDNLIGFSVIDENLGNIGEIYEFINIPVNPLIVVKNGNKEILIPQNNDFIIEVDNKTKTIKTKLPQGLIDINN